MLVVVSVQYNVCKFFHSFLLITIIMIIIMYLGLVLTKKMQITQEIEDTIKIGICKLKKKILQIYLWPRNSILVCLGWIRARFAFFMIVIACMYTHTSLCTTIKHIFIHIVLRYVLRNNTTQHNTNQIIDFLPSP